MIESEIELQFKLLGYLQEGHEKAEKGKGKTESSLKIMEQMRVIHDQVIPLVDDDVVEGILLKELGKVCKKVDLRRKEALYKYLAMKKF